jgi:hypothetical protein
MEDARDPIANRPLAASRRCLALGVWLFLGLCIFALPGCALFVLAGKMFFGDPEQTAAFQLATGVDLAEGEKKVVVLCSAPSMIEGGEISVNYEIVEEVSRQLKRRGVNLVSSNEVRTWMDDNGGRLDDPRDLAEDFEVDYIIYITLARVSFREENSPTLFQGVVNGEAFAYEVRKEDGEPVVNEVFSRGFSTQYPEGAPRDHVESLRIFQKEVLARASDQIAHMFYSHKISEEIF